MLHPRHQFTRDGLHGSLDEKPIRVRFPIRLLNGGEKRRKRRRRREIGVEMTPELTRKELMHRRRGLSAH
jgi:hypothetical protein